MKHFANFGAIGTVGKEFLKTYGSIVAPVGGAVLGGTVGSRIASNPEADKAYDAVDGYYFNNEGRIPDEQLLKTVAERESALNDKYGDYRKKNNTRALIGTGVGLLGGLALSRRLSR